MNRNPKTGTKSTDALSRHSIPTHAVEDRGFCFIYFFLESSGADKEWLTYILKVSPFTDAQNNSTVAQVLNHSPFFCLKLLLQRKRPPDIGNVLLYKYFCSHRAAHLVEEM